MVSSKVKPQDNMNFACSFADGRKVNRKGMSLCDQWNLSTLEQTFQQFFNKILIASFKGLVCPSFFGT